MTFKLCAMGERYSSASSHGKEMIGSTVDDADCTNCVLGKYNDETPKLLVRALPNITYTNMDVRAQRVMEFSIYFRCFAIIPVSILIVIFSFNKNFKNDPNLRFWLMNIKTLNVALSKVSGSMIPRWWNLMNQIHHSPDMKSKTSPSLQPEKLVLDNSQNSEADKHLCSVKHTSCSDTILTRKFSSPSVNSHFVQDSMSSPKHFSHPSAHGLHSALT